MAELPPECRAEPAAALAGGSDGLDVVGRLIEEAPRWLAPGGALVVEVGASPTVRAALDARFGLPFTWLDAARGGEGSSCWRSGTFAAVISRASGSAVRAPPYPAIPPPSSAPGSVLDAALNAGRPGEWRDTAEVRSGSPLGAHSPDLAAVSALPRR